MLILGDAAHADDVAWINPYREGAGAIGRAMESVERLAGLGARWACSGHGPAIVEPERALDAARERYEGWLERPESAAWHVCKRIAAYALMIRDGLAEGEATDHFASRPWAADFARHAFDADPREFARALIEELLRSGAARRSGGHDAGERVRASFARQGLMRLLGAEVVEVGEGTCVVEVPYSDGLAQQQRYFHGVVAGAIADSAGGTRR